MLFSLFAMADNWNATMYHQIEQSVKEPSFPDRTFNITSYGATPKASAAKNQKAINTAISICAKKVVAESSFLPERSTLGLSP